MTKRTSSDNMKIKNLVSIASLVVSNPGINRKKISEIAGISNQTVTNLVKELVDYGAISELQSENKGLGRPVIGLEFNYKAFYLITIEMTYNRASFYLHDLTGEISEECSGSLSLGCDLKTILESGVRNVLGDRDPLTVSAIILNAEGVLDEDSCRLSFIKSLGVKDFDIRGALSNIPIPVWAVNDVNVIAFDLKDRDSLMQNFIVVKYASGTGASTALNRHIARTGRHNMPGKFSHMKINDPHEHRKCWCGGENCLGTYFSKDALESEFKRPYKETIRMIAAGGMPDFRNFMIGTLSGVLVNIITLLGLERVYFCGECADILGPGFTQEMDEYIRAGIPSWITYKGMELVDIETSPRLSSKFYIHFVLENVMEYLEENERARGQISRF